MAEYELGPLIRSIYRSIRALFARSLRDSDFPEGQLDYFLEIYRKEGTNQQELAGTLGVTKAGVTKAVKILVARDLVERRTDPIDTRNQRLYLTRPGKVLAETFKARLERLQRSFMKDFSPEELIQFESYLRRLKESLRDLRIPG